MYVSREERGNIIQIVSTICIVALNFLYCCVWRDVGYWYDHSHAQLHKLIKFCKRRVDAALICLGKIELWSKWIMARCHLDSNTPTTGVIPGYKRNCSYYRNISIYANVRFCVGCS
jgi:hypothetical protein